MAFARQYVERHGTTILLTSLDRQAEYRTDQAAEIYLARSRMNPMARYKTHPPLDARSMILA